MQSLAMTTDILGVDTDVDQHFLCKKAVKRRLWRTGGPEDRRTGVAQGDEPAWSLPTGKNGGDEENQCLAPPTSQSAVVALIGRSAAF